MATDTILETQGLGKSFQGFLAVQGVGLRVQRGHIHALIGPNGAGKTTLFNLLTKVHAPTAGRILYNGRDITGLAPSQVARLGLIRSFQVSAVFPNLSAMENVRIGLQRLGGGTFGFLRPGSSLARLRARAVALLAEVGLEAVADVPAMQLPYGQKRALEIATTLAMEPELMLLDEPTQGMGHEDVDRISQLIRRVAAGRTVLLVEHNMSVVSGICDRITVLQRGEILAEGRYEEVAANPQVVEAYMGGADMEGAQP